MGIHKVLEAVCDWCSAGIDHAPGYTVPQMKKYLRDSGAIVQHNKTFCNQDCCDKWWAAKTAGNLPA